jgi:hypothetical protein
MATGENYMGATTSVYQPRVSTWGIDNYTSPVAILLGFGQFEYEARVLGTLSPGKIGVCVLKTTVELSAGPDGAVPKPLG